MFCCFIKVYQRFRFKDFFLQFSLEGKTKLYYLYFHLHDMIKLTFIYRWYKGAIPIFADFFPTFIFRYCVCYCNRIIGILFKDFRSAPISNNYFIYTCRENMYKKSLENIFEKYFPHHQYQFVVYYIGNFHICINA